MVLSDASLVLHSGHGLAQTHPRHADAAHTQQSAPGDRADAPILVRLLVPIYSGEKRVWLWDFDNLAELHSVPDLKTEMHC